MKPTYSLLERALFSKPVDYFIGSRRCHAYNTLIPQVQEWVADNQESYERISNLRKEKNIDLMLHYIGIPAMYVALASQYGLGVDTRSFIIIGSLEFIRRCVRLDSYSTIRDEHEFLKRLQKERLDPAEAWKFADD